MYIELLKELKRLFSLADTVSLYTLFKYHQPEGQLSLPSNLRVYITDQHHRVKEEIVIPYDEGINRINLYINRDVITVDNSIGVPLRYFEEGNTFHSLKD